jgi:hypothetical protein
MCDIETISHRAESVDLQLGRDDYVRVYAHPPDVSYDLSQPFWSPVPLVPEGRGCGLVSTDAWSGRSIVAFVERTKSSMRIHLPRLLTNDYVDVPVDEFERFAAHDRSAQHRIVRDPTMPM